MSDDVEAIVQGLSGSMRDAIGFWPRGYADPNTVKALRRRGLLIGSSLTDIGQAVRQSLLSSPVKE